MMNKYQRGPHEETEPEDTRRLLAESSGQCALGKW